MTRNHLLTLVAFLLAAAGACADGKIFRSPAAPPVEIPDQAALIHHDGAVQTLVIETAYESADADNPAAIKAATPYAWVVPLPAPPTEVFEASPALFNTLRVIFQPHIETDDDLILFLPISIAILLAVAAASRRARIPAIVAIMLVIVVAALLPALGKARAMASGPPSTLDLLDQRVVGDYDTVTIRADAADPDAPADLLAWLNDNDYAIEPDAESAIAAYVADGWCFVAARLRDDASTARRTPHPLGFRFPTARPVYPLRLTAAHGRTVDIDLYVFAQRRAAATGFDVVRCAETVERDRDIPFSARLRVILAQDELRDLAAAAPIATHLRGSLTPAAMARDATLTFQPAELTGNAVRTVPAAQAAAANLASVALLAVAVILMVLARLLGVEGVRAVALILLPSAVVATGFGAAMYHSMDPIELEDGGDVTWAGTRLLMSELAERADADMTVSDARALAESIIADLTADGVRNGYTGRPLQFEASPGNVSIVEIDGAPHLVVHGSSGGVDVEICTVTPDPSTD
ncbi:DUF2330 domain-containing protein [Pyruvatibacter sp.]|uniref:DUF2330 domain-containing protein n=1 Tax=Pyruvatibacter sp. TaxID=1981328 RepID=UPI0032EACEA3